MRFVRFLILEIKRKKKKENVLLETRDGSLYCSAHSVLNVIGCLSPRVWVYQFPEHCFYPE